MAVSRSPLVTELRPTRSPVSSKMPVSASVKTSRHSRARRRAAAVHGRGGLDRAQLERGAVDIARLAEHADELGIVGTDRHEDDRAELPLAVARLVDVQRLLHVHVELDDQRLSADHLERAARVQVELAVARKLRVFPVGRRLGNALGVALDQREVGQRQAHLLIRADRDLGRRSRRNPCSCAARGCRRSRDRPIRWSVSRRIRAGRRARRWPGSGRNDPWDHRSAGWRPCRSSVQPLRLRRSCRTRSRHRRRRQPG